jgi:preprotein translocase subunit SecD
VDFGGAVPDAERLRVVLNPPQGAGVIVDAWNDSEHRLVATETPAALTRADVAEATLQRDEMSDIPIIALRLTDHGKAVFGRLTSRCVKRLMPITFDGRAVMVPVVHEPIMGGVAHITFGLMAPDGPGTPPGQATSVSAAALVGGALQGTVTLE